MHDERIIMSEPREHVHVPPLGGATVTYPCGCINEIREEDDPMHRVQTCQKHKKMQREPMSLGLAYYEELGAIRDGIPQCPRYLRELEEALGPF
jgi:hypothetical protein